MASNIMPLPHGAEYSCSYNASLDAVIHHITLDGMSTDILETHGMPKDHFEWEWRAAIQRLMAALLTKPSIVTQGMLRISGLIRAKLPPGCVILPTNGKVGGPEFYLYNMALNASFGLPYMDEAFYINKHCNMNITQGEFDGEYRRTSPQVRSLPAPAPQSYPGGATPVALSPPGSISFVTSPSPEPAPERTGIESCKPKFGELVAYRAWFWDCVQRRLTSVGYYPLRWEPETPMYDAALLHQRIPHLEDENNYFISANNKAGIWSFKDFFGPVHEYLIIGGSGAYAMETATRHGLALVLGTCWIWGKVVEHQHGYRSQFGSIRSLDQLYRRDQPPGGIWRPERNSPLLDELREFYKLEQAD